MSKELKFVKFPGGYYVPANRRTYNRLVKLGLPSTQVLEETRAVLSLVLRKRKIPASMVSYSRVRERFFSKIEGVWVGEGRTAVFKGHTVTLNARAGSSKDKLIARVEKLLYDYAYRWGLSPDINITTTKRGRVKVYADLRPSKLRTPVITVSSDVVSQEKQELKLGSHRMLTMVQGKFLYWWLEAKSGSEYSTITYGKCLLTQVEGQYAHIQNIITSLA